jgi:hypothetical protein
MRAVLYVSIDDWLDYQLETRECRFGTKNIHDVTSKLKTDILNIRKQTSIPASDDGSSLKVSRVDNNEVI